MKKRRRNAEHMPAAAKTLAQEGVLVFTQSNLWDLVAAVKLVYTPKRIAEHGARSAVNELLWQMNREVNDQLRHHLIDEVARWAREEHYFTFADVYANFTKE
jgi:hypothetical protein